jgi:hypothetical protein
MLSGVILNVVMLSGVILNVVMLSVVAPLNGALNLQSTILITIILVFDKRFKRTPRHSV